MVAASERIDGKHKCHDFWSYFSEYPITKNITKEIYLFEIIYVSRMQSKLHRLPG